MYLRYTTRKKDGKVHRTWRLVRSVRIGRHVIQQTVTHLGELDEAGRVRARALARALIGEPEQASLFDDGTRSQTIAVQLRGVRIENGRQFVLWKTLELWQVRAGLGNSPRTLLEELARIQAHDVILPMPTHGEIRLRCVTQPDAAQAALLDRLGIVLPKRIRLPDRPRRHRRARHRLTTSNM